MDSAADALLFLSAATGVFPPDIACEQLLTLRVIFVLIEVLDQQFSMSLAVSHHLRCREFIRSSIEKFGYALSTVLCCHAVLRRESARASGPESARHLGEDWRAAPPGLIYTRREDTRSTNRKQVLNASS